MANTLLANAPMREIKRWSSGIAAANPATTQWIIITHHSKVISTCD